jgi:transposase InsO family protein
MQHLVVLELVRNIKRELPNIGVRKVYHKIQNDLERHQISIGRDKLFDLLGSHALLVKKRKRKVYTTDSNHPFRKYPNLIKEITLNEPERIWVSDITYIRVQENHSYLMLITDAYSKKIMGYHLSMHIDAKGCIKALEMAISGRMYSNAGLIHHSDRGLQYCSSVYTKLLRENEIDISMTENGDPYENAIAERVNGILKIEHGLDQVFESHKEAKLIVDTEIRKYNSIRPHASCDYLTPDEAHLMNGSLAKRWKKYPYKRKEVNAE